MEVMSSARVRQQQQLRRLSREEEARSEEEEDTWVLPLVQMKPLGIRTDEQVTQVSLFCSGLCVYTAGSPRMSGGEDESGRVCKSSIFSFYVSPVFQRLLTDAGPDSTVFLTSGYFNLTRAYMRLVLETGASYRILTASPEVNGFFGAKGIAGAIPAAYIHIARQFYNRVRQLGQQERVHLHEYHRPQWTFHAKGW